MRLTFLHCLVESFSKWTHWLKELGHVEKMGAKSVDLWGKVKKYHKTPCQIDGVKEVWRFKVAVFGPVVGHTYRKS